MLHLTALQTDYTPVQGCLHLRKKRIWDNYAQCLRTVAYPCGKCWNCIHSFRESWRIRLYETMVAQRSTAIGGFIYDTLTLAPESMPSVSAGDYWTGEAIFGVDAFHDEECMKIIDHYGGRVPVLYKETVSRWLRNGREKYNYFYRNEIKSGKRPRCPLRFFGALEYGPVWGRPHVHIAVFGVNRADWVRFWAKDWRRQMGFTKTKFIDLRQHHLEASEHCSRISTYISKYLMKGSLETPLVRFGLVPEPWRVVSHGIGEDLLKFDFQHRWDWIKNDMKYWLANRIAVDGNSNSELYMDSLRYVEESVIPSLDADKINSLKLYSQNGYKFSLPRYYRDKLLCSHNKGLAGSAIKVALFKDAINNCFEEVLQYATDCGLYPGKTEQWIRDHLERNLRAFNIAYFRYAAFKDVQNVRKAEWHRLSSLNFKRRLRAKPKTGDLGLLL